MVFYRGIAIDRQNVQTVLASITQTGISGNEGHWKFRVPDILKVRRSIDSIISLPGDQILKAIFDETPFSGICACGDEIGGRYYALKHNRTSNKTEPLLIVFTASMDDVYVDPRDFVCTAFQLWDREGDVKKDVQRLMLRELYGPRVLRYFDKASNSTDQKFRIAMCNLAAFDPQVVLDHYKNKKLIGGRYETRFCSAFFIKCPIKAEQIIDCIHLRGDVWQEPAVYVTLQSFLQWNVL